MARALTSNGNLPDPTPTPVLNSDTWLDPAFPWRSGIIIAIAILVMTTVLLIARSAERRRTKGR